MELLHSNIWWSDGVELLKKRFSYSRGLELYPKTFGAWTMYRIVTKMIFILGNKHIVNST
jgi:hypothetical protein